MSISQNGTGLEQQVIDYLTRCNFFKCEINFVIHFRVHVVCWSGPEAASRALQRTGWKVCLKIVTCNFLN